MRTRIRACFLHGVQRIDVQRPVDQLQRARHADPLRLAQRMRGIGNHSCI
jgi:hypothetical protein